MDLTGVIKVVMDEQKFDSGFFKREFVITTEEQYPQDIIFELHKERSEMIAGKQPGERVTVHFDVRGREWNGRYFNNLVGWKIESAAVAAAAGGQAPPSPESFPTIDPVKVDEGEDDDLPF